MATKTTDALIKDKYTNVPPGEIEVSHNFYYDQMKMDNDLLSKYRDYDRMDEEVIEIASTLDIYADNAVAGGNNLNKEFLVVLNNKNEKAQKIIDGLEKTDIHDITWHIARNVLKYGNYFVELVPRGDTVVRFKELPVAEMRLRKDEYGRLKSIVQKQDGSMGGVKEIELDIWKCVHFSMNRPYTYGNSILKSLRRISRQLRLTEDSIVLARLFKASQKIIYKIDVTGMAPAEALAYVKKWKQSMRRKKVMNPLTGEISEDYNPLRDEEDIFLPVKQNSATDVTPLEGDANISDIKDIELLQNRLFSGLKIPKAYLGFEGDTHNRNVITALDIQFARQVRRLQKVLEKGLRHIYDIAFILAGINPEDIDYKIIFPTISTIDALTEWQVNQTKLMTAQLVLGLGISLPDEWILSSLLGLPKSEVEQIIKYTKQVEKEQAAADAQMQADQAIQQQPGGQPGAQPGVAPNPAQPTNTGAGAGGGEGSYALSPEDMDRLNSTSNEDYSLTPDDMSRLNMEGSPAVQSLLKSLVSSNRNIQSLLEDTQSLISWKLDWTMAQNQVAALNTNNQRFNQR